MRKKILSTLTMEHLGTVRNEFAVLGHFEFELVGFAMKLGVHYGDMHQAPVSCHGVGEDAGDEQRSPQGSVNRGSHWGVDACSGSPQV